MRKYVALVEDKKYGTFDLGGLKRTYGAIESSAKSKKQFIEDLRGNGYVVKAVFLKSDLDNINIGG